MTRRSRSDLKQPVRDDPSKWSREEQRRHLSTFDPTAHDFARQCVERARDLDDVDDRRRRRARRQAGKR